MRNVNAAPALLQASFITTTQIRYSHCVLLPDDHVSSGKLFNSTVALSCVGRPLESISSAYITAGCQRPLSLESLQLVFRERDLQFSSTMEIITTVCSNSMQSQSGPPMEAFYCLLLLNVCIGATPEEINRSAASQSGELQHTDDLLLLLNNANDNDTNTNDPGRPQTTELMAFNHHCCSVCLKAYQVGRH